MKKVTELGERQKPCQFCGAPKSCPDWTCPRLKSVQVDSDGWVVEFWDPLRTPEGEPEGPKAA
jgi:hypothetical protein